jgi:hypothetical protein
MTVDELIENKRYWYHVFEKMLADEQAKPDNGYKAFGICVAKEQMEDAANAIISLQQYKKCLAEQPANPRLRC